MSERCGDEAVRVVPEMGKGEGRGCGGGTTRQGGRAQGELRGGGAEAQGGQINALMREQCPWRADATGEPSRGSMPPPAIPAIPVSDVCLLPASPQQYCALPSNPPTAPRENGRVDVTRIDGCASPSVRVGMHMRIHMHMRMRAHMHTHLRIHTHICATHTCTCTCTCTFICMCDCLRIDEPGPVFVTRLPLILHPRCISGGKVIGACASTCPPHRPRRSAPLSASGLSSVPPPTTQKSRSLAKKVTTPL